MMSQDHSPRLKLAFIIANQAQKHVSLNESLLRLDSLVQASVISATVVTEPSVAADGDAYILPNGATGPFWSLFPAQSFVRFESATWDAIEFPLGAIVYLASETRYLIRTLQGWDHLESTLTSMGPLDRLGIGTHADDYNRLSFKGQAALLSAQSPSLGGTGNLSLAMNKDAPTNHAQIMWQQGFESRFILGLLGSNDLTLKASVNGQTYFDLWSFNARSGRQSIFKPAFTKPDPHKRRYLFSRPWHLSPTPADLNWRSLAYAPELGLIVAVAASGNGQRVMTSFDGIAWSQGQSAFDHDWTSVIWAASLGKFIAVAASGIGNRVMTSEDGLVWQAQQSAADHDWQSVCFSPELGLCVAVANSGIGNRVMTSPDGVVWTLRQAAADQAWSKVVWAAELGIFVAISTSGTGSRVMISANGKDWQLQSTPADYDWQGLCYAPELRRLVSVASSGGDQRVMTSSDGIAWSLCTTPAALQWSDVVFAPEIGAFVAIAQNGNGNQIMRSNNGIDWTSVVTPQDASWRSLIWVSGLMMFCACASSGTETRVMTSVSALSMPYRA